VKGLLIRQAIAAYVIQPPRQHEPADLIQSIDHDEHAVKVEMWEMLASGQLELTWDRKLKAGKVMPYDYAL
jgi:hypothetical protein